MLFNSIYFIICLCEYTFRYHLYDLFAKHWSSSPKLEFIFGQYYENFYNEVTYRFNAIIHSLYTSIFVSFYLLGLMDAKILDVIFLNSMAYCLYDFYGLCTQKNPDHDKGKFMVHHLLMFAILFLNYNSDQIRKDLIAKGLLAEWSTIFLNFSIILYKSGLGNYRIFTINSSITVASYMIFRILLYPFLIYQTFYQSYIYGLLSLVFYSFNWIWFMQIVNHHKKSVSKKMKRLL